MTRWTSRCLVPATLLVAVAGAHAQDLGPIPTETPIDLPFSRDPSSLLGPPRSMGEAGFNQALPPSDRATQFGGPPRSMGELTPDQTLLPGQTYGGNLFPLRPGLGFDALRPDFLGTVGAGTFIDPNLPNELLMIPGLLDTGTGPGTGSVASGSPDQVGPPVGPLPSPPRVDDAEPLPPLTWPVLRTSTENQYPPFLAALLGRDLEDGEVLSAMGNFDLGLSADSRNYPLGYYNRTVQDVFLEQPILRNGGKVFAGYRVGTGTFPSYYLNLQTREGGAFVSGFEFPLLRDRAIDAKRVKLFRTELDRRKVEPAIQKDRISLLKNASKAYWEWIGAGFAHAITQDLVARTDDQFAAIQALEKAGRVSPVAVLAFQSVVLKRKQQLVQTRKTLQNSTISLSLFLRDARGLPTLADHRAIPDAFPPAPTPDESLVMNDLSIATDLRPEIRSIELDMRKTQVDRDYATNQRLPRASLYVYTEQNVGRYTSNLGPDFRPFIAETSLLFEVPVQRRYARGLEQAASARLRQLAAARQYAIEEIRAEVLATFNSLQAAYQDLQLYRGAELISRQLEVAERKSLQAGRSNQLLLFVREQTTYDQAILRVVAEAKFFSALADHRAAIGLDAVTSEIERLAPPEVAMATLTRSTAGSAVRSSIPDDPAASTPDATSLPAVDGAGAGPVDQPPPPPPAGAADPLPPALAPASSIPPPRPPG